MYRDPSVALTNNGTRLEHRIGVFPQHDGGVRAENPADHRIDRLLVDGKPVERDRTHPVAFVTEQGVPLPTDGLRERAASG